jgi:basic amino acid/polyamine antiporter, APA family
MATSGDVLHNAPFAHEREYHRYARAFRGIPSLNTSARTKIPDMAIPSPIVSVSEPAERATPTLLRALGTWDVSLITFGSIVGSAIFVAAGIVPREMPQPAVMMGLWVLGGLLTLAGVAIYAELGTMFPEAGGQYHYLKAAFGPLCGFLFGWTAFLVMQTAAIAYLAVASAERLGVFLPYFLPTNVVANIPLGVTTLSITGSKVGAVVAIALLSTINYFGLMLGTRFQNAISFVKIASLVALVGFGLTAPATVETQWTMSPPPHVDLGHAIGVAMIAVLWCYDGYFQATLCGGEIRDPGRSLPRGMVLGTLLTLTLFILVNLVYVRALPVEELGRANGIAEASATALFGAEWAPLISLAVLVSIFGCLSACVLTSARIYLPMAQDKLFFRSLARIHPVYRTPSACIVAQGLWSIVLAFSGTYEQLGTYSIFAIFLFHAATGTALVVLRRTQPALPRPYRAWGYPWTPVFFVLTALAFVVNTLVVRPIESLWGVLLIALGLPAYFWWRRRQ